MRLLRWMEFGSHKTKGGLTCLPDAEFSRSTPASAEKIFFCTNIVMNKLFWRVIYILGWFKIESLYLPEEMLGAKMISIRSSAHPTPSIRFNIHIQTTRRYNNPN